MITALHYTSNRESEPFKGKNKHMIKNRIELAKYFNELGFKYGAEIGACFGRYSEILCQNIPGLKLIAIDSWSNRRNTKREDIAKISGEESTRIKLAPYNAVVIRASSMDALPYVEDGTLDFVFIDADHKYDSVAEDIREWSKKVRVGGIVSGHDYCIFKNSGNRGVIDAVDEYVKKHGIELLTTSWDKKNPVSDDCQPCRYFFKK